MVGTSNMRNLISGLLAASCISFAAGAATASSLSISPISVEVPTPAGASRITLENDGTDPVNAQVRVFKWVQRNGKDELVPTRDVVASPPAIKMLPGKKTLIRVVRVNKAPIAAEETYRLLVDEVPQPAKEGQRAVSFTIQYSVPVFFQPVNGRQQLSWNARIAQGKLVVEAANAGTRRAKLSQMKIGLPDGKAINVSEGLAGYVLTNSRKVWLAKPRALKPGSKITITAQSEQGPINVTASVAAQ
jgi:fimbrial chaperone protein